MAKKILIVDDEADVRTYLEVLFEENGYETAVAVDGDVAMAKTREFKPDAITLDIIMPKVEGLDAISALKAMIKINPHAKVVMVSAMGQEEVVEEYIQAGAKDFIVKPFKPSNVTGVVKSALKE